MVGLGLEVLVLVLAGVYWGEQTHQIPCVGQTRVLERSMGYHGSPQKGSHKLPWDVQGRFHRWGRLEQRLEHRSLFD